MGCIFTAATTTTTTTTPRRIKLCSVLRLKRAIKTLYALRTLPASRSHDVKSVHIYIHLPSGMFTYLKKKKHLLTY